jgi:hypothetical protein
MLHVPSLTAKAKQRRIASWITLFFIAIYAGNIWAGECFDNEDVLKLQAKSREQRGALVYVWSPRMVYSMQNMALASRAAAAAGLGFIVLHDDRVPKEEMQQAMLASLSAHPGSRWNTSTELDPATPTFASLTDYSRPLCAPELIQREALRHFPTAFVISPQGIHPQPIVGAMPWQGWVSSLNQRLNSRQPTGRETR